MRNRGRPRKRGQEQYTFFPFFFSVHLCTGSIVKHSSVQEHVLETQTHAGWISSFDFCPLYWEYTFLVRVFSMPILVRVHHDWLSPPFWIFYFLVFLTVHSDLPRSRKVKRSRVPSLHHRRSSKQAQTNADSMRGYPSPHGHHLLAL